jgi:antitoxin component YwqK of YwqJK toxin-antitoxin module
MKEETFEIIDEQLDKLWVYDYVLVSWRDEDWELKQAQGFSLEQTENEKFLIFDHHRHGLCESYYPCGSLRSTSFYSRSLLHGPVIYYSLNQQKLSQSYYVEGKKWGPFRLWYPQGALYSEQHFLEGEKEGRHTYFFEKGQLKTQIDYKNGIVEGCLEQRYENGKQRRYSQYCNGMKEGLDLIWSVQGYPLLQAYYEKNQPTGQLCYYHDEGVLAERYQYLGPAWKFHVERFDRQGRLWQQGMSHKDGSYEEKTFDKQLQLKEHLIHFRDDKGQTLRTVNFVNK